LKNWTVVDGNTYTHLADVHKGTLHDAQQTDTSAHTTLVDQHWRQMVPVLPQSWAVEAAASSDAFAVDYVYLSSPEMHQPTTDAGQLNANCFAQTHPPDDSAISPEAWMVLHPNAHQYPVEKGQQQALVTDRILKPRRL
jgi:murein tripeptide amidase MpaA